LVKTNGEGDRVSELHFLLSNADRRRMIEELQTQNLRLNEVAKKLDITPTEAFRQLQRLTDAGFLEKSSEGKYRSTPYSRLVIESSSTVEFLSKHREYFLDHDTSLIPPQFRARLGELSKTVLHTEMVSNINTGTKVLENAETRIDIMAEDRLDQHGQIIRRRLLKDGIKVRTLVPESLLESIKGELVSADSGEMRYVPRVCAIIIMTEKIVGISFPKLDGKMDYQVFACIDPESMRWAGDLFEDQWNRARPWNP
jgi:predicted transcriptional regulator